MIVEGGLVVWYGYEEGERIIECGENIVWDIGMMRGLWLVEWEEGGRG
jgi:hypothetical protein